MTNVDPQDLADRYVAVWQEPDAERRRKSIHELWAEDGAHILQPPLEMISAAAGLGFTLGALEAHGHDALEARVSHGYEQFVAPGEFLFRRRGDAVRLHNLVKFYWEMVPTGGDEVAGAGLEILVLGEDGRITADYQFIDR
jgi:hypothetical protein